MECLRTAQRMIIFHQSKTVTKERIGLRNDSGPVLIRGKFTPCEYRVNNFPDLFFGNCWGYEAIQLKFERNQKNFDCQLDFGTSRARL
jgi:hypothetical protein